MATLAESATWSAGIYQLELTDPVLGGPDGIDNLQAKQLANRTAWLKAQVEARAPLASPILTGAPSAPTAPPGSNTSQLANTAFVQAALSALVASSPAALDTLNELAIALGNDPNFATTITNALAGKQALDEDLTAIAALASNGLIERTGAGAVGTVTVSAAAKTLLDDASTAAMLVTLGAAALASPSFTGTPSVPTAAPGTNTTQVANTAFVQAAISALISSSPAALDTLNELALALGNDANFATTMTNALALKATLASPALTGVPTAPTPAVGDSSQKIATTAFVQGTQTSVQGLAKNVFATANGLNALVAITADEVVVKDSNGNALLLSSLALSINTAVNGANGLDMGSIAASQWYSDWAIFGPSGKAAIAALCPVVTGTTTAGSAVVSALASTVSMRVGMPFAGGSFPQGTVIKSVDSPTQVTATQSATASASNVQLRFVYEPVLPNGYTHKARLGMFPTDETANKFPKAFTQFGSFANYDVVASTNVSAAPVMASGIVGNPTGPVWAPIAVGAAVPPTARAIYVIAFAQANACLAPHTGYGGPSSAINPPPWQWVPPSTTSKSDVFRLPLKGPNIFAIFTTAASSVGCLGWEDSL